MLILEMVRRVKPNHPWCKSILFGSLMLLLAVQSAFANISIAVSDQQTKLVNEINLSRFGFGPVTDANGIATADRGGYNLAPVDPQNFLAKLPYLYVTEHGIAALDFSAPQTQFSLLWGSVDDYNHLIFSNKGSSFTVNGSDVISPSERPLSVLDSGSRWVLITATGGDSFDKVTFTSTLNSFEATSFTSTPEPGFYGVLALGISGLWFAVGRRRRA